MPYPAQMDAERIVEVAREMIEAEGVDNLSLNKLAAALGVKAPSLYRHFASKNDLLRAVNLQTWKRLVDKLLVGIDEARNTPQARVLAMAQAYRAFAHANPMTYALATSSILPEIRPDPGEMERLALLLQDVMAELVGEDRSLVALRGVWALTHGFAILELNGQFQRGGDLDEAFHQTVNAYIAGLTMNR